MDTLGCMSRATQHFVVSFENYRPALVWKLTYCMVYAVGIMCGVGLETNLLYGLCCWYDLW